MALPRHTVVPLPDHQVSFQVEGEERLRWHFGAQYPGPFLYPLLGPATGQSLTRMGHPGAPNHDHHRSIWFAHSAVQGINFWSMGTSARVHQKEWLAYDDGEVEARMAVRLGWNDGHDAKDLLEQELIVGIRDLGNRETLVELQTTLRPTSEQLELGKTNFGLMAVRVAKAISSYFGKGVLTSSHGSVGEPAIFGKTALWMDYSGEPVQGKPEGVTFLDHPSNPGYPSHWHVREDGWMGASLCFAAPRLITKTQPLTLRYLLHAHSGWLDPKKTDTIRIAFETSAKYLLKKSPAKHTAYGIVRA